MQRGEIYLGSVSKAEARGHEQRDTDDNAPRPWVIVSDPRIAARAKLVVTCPLTSKTAKDERMDPFRVLVDESMIATTPQASESSGNAPSRTLVTDFRASSRSSSRPSSARNQPSSASKNRSFTFTWRCRGPYSLTSSSRPRIGTS
ncbi:MAG: type II toxin-antitoxin system PemK/MazF family toxin [Deltaproteobacteria bacterium]|nr:type II toxin-antitoxin system PemK/MazF family toxin [Deltaproteobacteria bacterium]